MCFLILDRPQLSAQKASLSDQVMKYTTFVADCFVILYCRRFKEIICFLTIAVAFNGWN